MLSSGPWENLGKTIASPTPRNDVGHTGATVPPGTTGYNRSGLTPRSRVKNLTGCCLITTSFYQITFLSASEVD